MTLARWVSNDDLTVLILDEPTRRIDVNLKARSTGLIAAIAERGVAVVVMSSELPEPLSLCDRIHVLCDGPLAATATRGSTRSDGFGRPRNLGG